MDTILGILKWWTTQPDYIQEIASVATTVTIATVIAYRYGGGRQRPPRSQR